MKKHHLNKKLLIIPVALTLGGVVLMSLRSNSLSKTSHVKNAQPTPDEVHKDYQEPSAEEGVLQTSIEIHANGFSSKTLYVKKGTEVIWHNEDDDPHSATADNGEWDTGIIESEQTKSVTLEKSGEYSYHSSPQPELKARIIVQD